MKIRPIINPIAIVSFSVAIAFIVLILGGVSLAAAQTNKPVIVIQPGHGQLGDDGVTIENGAAYNGLIEKDVNLAVAKYAQEFLKRCPVEVYLTRDGDDKQHQLYQVAQIVQSYHPTVAVAIHTDTGSASGTGGWYTDGGYDDQNSKLLASLLAERIASQFGINNFGSKPDSKNRLGRLYIKDWKVTSALIEIAVFKPDYEAIKNNQKDFGRAITRAILEYLNIDPTCADNAAAQGLYASTYFPASKGTNSIAILNDGVLPWKPGEYQLKSVGDPYGAASSYSLPGEIYSGKTVQWEIPVKTLINPGIYRQSWQIWHGDVKVGKPVTIYIIVVPQQAKDLKIEIDKKIEEIKQQGEQALEKYIRELEKQAIQWIEKQISDQICPATYSLLFVPLILLAGTKKKK